VLPRLFLWPAKMPHLLKIPNHILGRRGHNLLEVVIASAIFATAIVFFAALWVTHHSALTQSRNRIAAGGLARLVLEQRLAGGFSSLAPFLDTPQVQFFDSRSQIRGRESNQKFKSTFLVTDGATPEYIRLTVTIDWEERTGDKSLSYESCLFKTE
jgi:hypothetical protein